MEDAADVTVSRSTRIRSVGTQAIFLALATASSQVLVALIYLLAARSSTPAEYGQVVVAIALGTAAVGFVDLGANALWTREMASERLDRTIFSSRVSGKLLWASGIAALGLLLSLAFAPHLIAAPAVLLAGTLGQTLLVPLRALRRGDAVALLLFAERVFAVIIFLVLLVIGVGTDVSLWIALAGGTSVMAVVAWWATPRDSRPLASWPPSFPWLGARYYAISTIASSGQQLDLPLLTAVAGSSAAGLYGAVNRWTQPMGVLATAFSSAATPFVAKARDWREVRHVVSRAAWLLGLAVAACTVLILVAPWLTPLLLGEAYTDSAMVLQILAAGTIPAILNQPLAAALQARNYDHLVAYVFLSCVAGQLVLVLVLGTYLGATGAALAFFALQCVLLVALVCCVIYAQRRDTREAPMVKDSAA